MWMLIEGFQLYRLGANVLSVQTSRKRRWMIYYTIFAYAVPFFIVGITVLTANGLEPKPYNETSDFNMTGIMQAYSGEETYYYFVKIIALHDSIFFLFMTGVGL